MRVASTALTGLFFLHAGVDTAPEPDLDALMSAGSALLLAAQESLETGGEPGEWPYEGVYRVDGRIPVGYRIGGTAICGLALLHDPAAPNPPRDAALGRATAFICRALRDPAMAHAVESRYDVRGWGYTYALHFLLRIKPTSLLADDVAAQVDPAIAFCLQGIAATEIPQEGGWNYARPRGFDQPGPPSPFMTAPTLLALFEAARCGHAVDPALIERGLQALERSRDDTGAFAYAGSSGGARSAVPGAVGRMAGAELVLMLAGRSDLSRVRGAVDAFLVHWGRLEERRARSGTHEGPFGVAPYYFYYAHYYAALAIELLPERDRPEYRARLRALLLQTRGAEGGWNDRVFPRSAAYGTAMAMLALSAPAVPPPPRWTPTLP
jgi:hypothetical protein